MSLIKRNLSGWTPSPPDFRDLVYKVPANVAFSLPDRLDLSKSVAGAPWDARYDQLELGSCGAWAAAGDLVFEELQGNAGRLMPSPLFIYYAARKLMGTVGEDSGVNNRSLLKALKSYGWCDEALWPYDTSRFKERPTQAAIDQAATRKISEYRSVPQDPTHMKGCLAEGNCIIFGFTVYESMLTPTVDQTGRIPMPAPDEKVVGGHDVLLCGWDDGRGAYKFRNWWGRWGDAGSGFGWAPYAYAHDPKLSSDFWTVTDSGLPKPLPPMPPVPPPVPVDDRVTLDAAPLVAALRAAGYIITKG